MLRAAARAGVWLLAALLLYVLSGAAFLPEVVALRWARPGPSALMRLREEGGTQLRPREWTPLSRTAPALVEAVLAGEDDLFASHDGFHLLGLREAARRNVRDRRLARGGSTITQQLAKNLWLNPARNPLRKVKEAGLTAALEAALPKPRILELYLNVVEWGPGLFGVGAASRAYFQLAPSQLTHGQAALLAAALPDPLRRDPARPGPWLRRQQAVIRGRISRWNLAPEEWTRPTASPARR